MEEGIIERIGEIELYFYGFLREFFIFYGGYLFLEHTKVERETDIFTFPSLLESEDIPSTPDFHISHSDLESCTQVRIIGDRDDSLFFYGSEFTLAIHEIAVTLLSFSPDSSSELVELSKTEILGIDDDDRICSEEIHSIFDDGCGEEDIMFSFFESMDTILDLLAWHLAMSDDDLWLIILRILLYFS